MTAKQAESIFRALPQQIAVIATDMQGMINVFNVGAEQLLNYPAHEIVTKTRIYELLKPSELEEHTKRLAQLMGQSVPESDYFKIALESGHHLMQSWVFQNKMGETIPTRVNLSAMTDQENQTIGILFTIVADNKYLYDSPLQLMGDLEQFQASIDTEIRRCQRQQQAISVLKICIDNFPGYVRSQGERLGQDCLETVARVLLRRVKRAGDVLAYNSEDAFFVLLPSTSEGGAVKLAEHLRLLIAAEEIPFDNPIGGHDCVTASIGIASQLAEHPSQARLFMKDVDQAVQAAQRDGGHCSRFSA